MSDVTFAASDEAVFVKLCNWHARENGHNANASMQHIYGYMLLRYVTLKKRVLSLGWGEALISQGSVLKGECARIEIVLHSWDRNSSNSHSVMAVTAR
jgi:hypothetical protein